MAVLFVSMLLFSGLSLQAVDRLKVENQGTVAAKHLPRIARLPAAKQLRFAIGLPLRNMPALTNLLHELYSPASTNFHKYLTPEQFAVQFGPTEQDYQALINFAERNRLEVVGRFGNRAILDVSGTVTDIEKAFQVTLGTYQHPTEQRQFYGPDIEPSVDASLSVLYIVGLDNYVIPRPASVKSTPFPKGSAPNVNNGSGQSGTYLGYDFRRAYAPGTLLTGAGQVVGLVELDGYTPSDIQMYENLGGLPQVPLLNVLLDGVANSAGPNNREVALDIEVVIAMAPGLSQVNVYEGNNHASVMNEIAHPNQGEPLPSQVSCSWGISGDASILQALLQMGAQGQSFFYASGDNGAYPVFTPASYVDEIYLTSIGGTELSMNGVGASWQSETVWNSGPGFEPGGGIFINVPIPEYQIGINMSVNQGSSQWRNAPDVAMCADQIETVDTIVNGSTSISGQVDDVGGTSAAAPLWAGFIALVNQQAAAQGKAPVGFLNPAIYEIAKGPSYANCFHDITSGNNTNAASPNLYYAAPGYDLCTGWGTPTGTNLINALVGLSGPVFVDFNYTGTEEKGTYEKPFRTLAGGTNAVSARGTIFIKTAGSSPEKMMIAKPMRITAILGPATIGHQ